MDLIYHIYVFFAGSIIIRATDRYCHKKIESFASFLNPISHNYVLFYIYSYWHALFMEHKLIDESPHLAVIV